MKRNVILVCLDSVRKDFFNRYASHIPKKSDTVLEQCRAASSWSTPSHASILTGMLPSNHGIHTHQMKFSKANNTKTFISSLSNHKSVGISVNIFFNKKFDFDIPFNRFISISTGCRNPKGIDVNKYVTNSNKSLFSLFLGFPRKAIEHEYPIKSLLNGVLALINVASTKAPIPKLLDDGTNAVISEAKNQVPKSKPLFMMINLGEAHIPLRHILGYKKDLHSAPNKWSTDEVNIWDIVKNESEEYDKYLKRRRELYGAAIEYLDRKVIELYKKIDNKSPFKTTLIVTSDHGENLGFKSDEYLLNHKASLSESLLHVPLHIIGSPGNAPNNVKKFTSHLDLGKLIIELSNNNWIDISRETVPAEVIGLSPGPDPPNSNEEYWNRMIRCVYKNNVKYEWDSKNQTKSYDIDNNKTCWQSLKQENISIPSWAKNKFDVEIKPYKNKYSKKEQNIIENLNNETKSRLQDLGYL